MRRVVGARTVVEAVFLVAVPVVALEAGLSVLGIVLASAAAYLVVLVVEGVVVREERATGRRRPAPQPAAPERAPAFEVSPTEVVRVLRPEPEAAPEPELWSTEPEPTSEREPEPQPEQAQARLEEAGPVVDEWRVPTREEEVAPEVEAEVEVAPEPDFEAAAGPEEPEPERVVLALLPPPEPEPELELEVEAVPEPEPGERVARVVPIGAVVQPRRWNIWDLEQLARSEPARNEERTFLLLYLREFADPNGLLPVDFDGLVRESFGDLVGVG